MTILFFARLFYPHIGGVEKHVLEIGKRLVKKGHKIIVITEKYQSESSSAKLTGEVKGIEILRIPVKRDSGLSFDSAQDRQNDGRGTVVKEDWFSFGKLRINKKKFKIWRWLWQHKNLIKNADIVHCHDIFFWYLPFRFLYFRKPVYTTFHGYESYPVKKTSYIVRKISEKLSWGNICVGDYIRKWYGTKPDYITYGGVNKIKNEKLKIKNYIEKFKNNQRSALFVGRLDEQTGILQYCNAVEMVLKTYPGFEFGIAGDGHLKERVKKHGNVFGFIDNPERLFAHYRFAFVSRYLSILEAMAMKRLVFALYDNPIKRDYLILSPFSEFIVVGGSARQLAEKVIWFNNHPQEERKIIERAYAFATNQTWDNVVDKYVKLWSIH